MSARPTESSIAHRLWEDDTIFDHAVRTAERVHALDRRLRKRKPRNEVEREFLRLVSWLESLDQAVTARIWADPRAFHWISVAERSESRLNTSKKRLDEEAWNDHLIQFGLFGVSAAHLSGRSLSLNGIPLGTPEVLPATCWSISNECGTVWIRGIKEGKFLQLSIANQPFSITLGEPAQDQFGVTLHQAPQVSLSSGQVTLQPHEFHLSGIDELDAVVGSSPESQQGLLDELESSLACIESYVPTMYRQIVEQLNVIAFKPQELGGHWSGSSPQLPGAAIFTEGRHPLVLAEDLIREYYWNRFAALERTISLTECPANRRPNAYSPWQNNPVSVRSLIGEVYVYERALSFWLSVISSNELIGIELEYAAFRVAKLCSELQIAMGPLHDENAISTDGRACLVAMAESLKDHLATAQWLGIAGDAGVIDIEPEGQFARRVDADGNILSVDRVIDQHRANHRKDALAKQLAAA